MNAARRWPAGPFYRDYLRSAIAAGDPTASFETWSAFLGAVFGIALDGEDLIVPTLTVMREQLEHTLGIVVADGTMWSQAS